MYRELLLTGKLAQHCANIDETALQMAEKVRADYLKVHPMPEEDVMERIRLSTQTQMIADEIVTYQLICI